MSSRQEEDLIAWVQTFDPAVQDYSHFRTGTALMAMIQSITGAKYSYTKEPITTFECWKNATIFLQAFYTHFEDTDLDLNADDIIQGNKDRILLVIQLLHSTIEEKKKPKAPFLPIIPNVLAKKNENEDPEMKSEQIEEIGANEMGEYEEKKSKKVKFVEEFDPEKCDLSGYDNNKVIVIQQFLQVFLAKKKHEQIIKREKHRHNCATEIYETEQSYVKVLEALSKVYFEQLEFNTKTSPHPILSHDEVQKMFSNIKEVYTYNKELLQQLKNRIENWHTHQRVGDIFARMAPFLSLYTVYCNNFEQATETLQKCRKKEDFENFLSECKNNPLDIGLPLDALLITPIQRVPRYILLLRDLIKHTDVSNPDYQNLRNAIIAIEKQAASVNQNITKSEAKNEVVLIQEKLVGDNVPNIVLPSRYYLTEAKFKFCNLDTKKEYASVYIFLFNDLFLATKRINSKMYRYKFHITLKINFVRLKDLPDFGVLQNSFSLIAVKKTVILACDTIELKNEWMNTINKLIAVGAEKLRSRTTKLGGIKLSDHSHMFNLSASIMGTKTVYNKETGAPFTVYVIHINTNERNGLSYTIYRRYREFFALYKTLKKQFPRKEFIPLPKKHIIGNLSKDIVESRTIMLEIFLEDLLMKKSICKNNDFVIFLQPSDNYLTEEPQTLSTSRRATKLLQPEHLKKLEEERKLEEKRKKKEASRKSTIQKPHSSTALDSYMQSLNATDINLRLTDMRKLSSIVDLPESALKKMEMMSRNPDNLSKTTNSIPQQQQQLPVGPPNPPMRMMRTQSVCNESELPNGLYLSLDRPTPPNIQEINHTDNIHEEEKMKTAIENDLNESADNPDMLFKKNKIAKALSGPTKAPIRSTPPVPPPRKINQSNN